MLLENEQDLLSLEDKILRVMAKQGSSLSWLARETDYSYSHLNNTLKAKGPHKTRITEKLLLKINEVLQTDFKL